MLIEWHLDEADLERKQLPQLKVDELASKHVTVNIVKKQHARSVACDRAILAACQRCSEIADGSVVFCQLITGF